jgi:hypothetical protein
LIAATAGSENYDALAAERPKLGRSQALEREVKTVEQRWLDYEDSPAVVQSIRADDFVYVLPGGFIYGQLAIATGIVSNIPESNGKPARFIFTDVFVRRAGKWLAVNAQELPLELVLRPAP